MSRRIIGVQHMCGEGWSSLAERLSSLYVIIEHRIDGLVSLRHPELALVRKKIHTKYAACVRLLKEHNQRAPEQTPSLYFWRLL